MLCVVNHFVHDEAISKHVLLIVTLQHLTRLVLSNNRITLLPPDIVQLSSLEYLSLFNNHLEVSNTFSSVVWNLQRSQDLPSTISSLTKLRELNVA